MKNEILFVMMLSATFSTAAQDTAQTKAETLPVYYVTTTVFRYTNNLHELEGVSTKGLTPATDVSPQATESFMAAFKNARNIQWYFYDKSGKTYLVAFDLEKREGKALTDRKGKIFYTLVDGSETDLSKTMAKLIKAWYPDYNIIGLVKVNSKDKDAAIMNLKNGHDLTVISVEDDIISEMGLYSLKFENTPVAKGKKEN